MHKGRRLRLNQERSKYVDSSDRYPNKTVVMGLLDREQRKVRASVVPNIKRQTLQSVVLKEVHHGTRLYTDQATAYEGLAAKYAHDFVNHLQGYVNGRVHTNGLENFWSLLKRGLHGTYVAVEPFHLFRYVDEQAFRYNNRGTRKEKITDSDRFELALSQVAGKRLTFEEVTGKDWQAPF